MCKSAFNLESFTIPRFLHGNIRCNCRKPKTAMIEQAAQDFKVSLRESFVIGDRDDMDGAMARKLGIPYQIIIH